MSLFLYCAQRVPALAADSSQATVRSACNEKWHYVWRQLRAAFMAPWKHCASFNQMCSRSAFNLAEPARPLVDAPLKRSQSQPRLIDRDLNSSEPWPLDYCASGAPSPPHRLNKRRPIRGVLRSLWSKGHGQQQGRSVYLGCVHKYNMYRSFVVLCLTTTFSALLRGSGIDVK